MEPKSFGLFIIPELRHRQTHQNHSL